MWHSPCTYSMYPIDAAAAPIKRAGYVRPSEKAVLPALLEAESAMPPPFISMGLDGARYYALLADAMREDDDEEMSEEMREAVSGVMSAAADFYERLQVDVTFTKRGVEIETDRSLAD